MKHLKTFKIFESFSEKLYHGNRKGDFPPEKRRFAGAIFLTGDLNFAKDFAGFNDGDDFPEGAVWEVKLKPNLKICDPMQVKTMKELDLKSVLQKMIDIEYEDPANGKKFKSNRGSGLKGFDYDSEREFDLEDKKYDGFEVTEKGNKNLAIFDESSIERFDKIQREI